MEGEIITILLPLDRTQPGTLSVLNSDGSAAFGPVACLGKADNGMAAQHGNVGRDSTKPYGDTPLGTYAAVPMWRPSVGPTDMGNLIIPLHPLTGDAWLAEQNGRTGLAIHGGRGSDRLIPTDGCVRLLDKDIASLSDFMGNSALPIVIKEMD
jgi:hypothetical protein